MRTWNRVRLPGGTYFFTVVTAGRQPLFDSPSHVRCLGAALRATRASHPFSLDALVLLPDHLHCIWTLPANDSDYALRWELVKKRCSAAMRRLSPSIGARAIWQPRFWEHCIRDDRDRERHLDYIHYNPVKHGHVTQADAWPYSTFARFVRAGVYDPNWGGEPPRSIGDMDSE